MPYSNYHTHTQFCDGNEEAENFVSAAIAKGFTQLGFSAHTMLPLLGKKDMSDDWHLPVKEYSTYCKEIHRLKEIYADQIEIFCGFEAEYFPLITEPKKDAYKEFPLDYLIGSLHYVVGNNPQVDFFTIDGPVEEIQNGLDSVFGGDAKKMVQTFFSLQREMITLGDFDFLGHPDVIRKRNSVMHLFDESEAWYKGELEETARLCAQKNIVIEINTGGIARGAIDDVYPSHDFLLQFNKYNVPLVINSDAHSASDLDCAYDRAYLAARNAGYKSYLTFEKKEKGLSWKERPL